MATMLTSEEAASRLGVKVTTLYVYVSRGLLSSHKDPTTRRSLFAIDDVEALARRSRGGKQIESRMAVVNTSITQLRDSGPTYRGTPAVELLGSGFEQVAELLWQQAPAPWRPLDLGPSPALARRDLLAWCTLMAANADPLRSDPRPESVCAAARSLISTMAATQPMADPSRELGVATDRPIASELAQRLCGTAPDAAAIAAIDSMLVLLADHELSTSTLAVRVAASTRADLYDAVLSGLGTAAGPLHGSASRFVLDLLGRAQQVGAAQALDDALRFRGVVPGFGHATYTDGDPRVAPMRECFDAVAAPQLRALLDDVIDIARRHDMPAPNVDLLLGATAIATGMDHDGVAVVFIVARCAGWVAHYLEELGERPLRFRARAVYATASEPGHGSDAP